MLAGAALLSVLGLGCRGVVAAADAGPSTDPLSVRMAGAVQRLKTRGYGVQGDALRSFLIEGKADVHPVSLRAGRCVTLVGTSSEALADLEVKLFDGAGREVASEEARAPSAVLHACPERGGPHYLVVRAAAGNGIYLVQRFDSPPGLGPVGDVFDGPRPGTVPQP